MEREGLEPAETLNRISKLLMAFEFHSPSLPSNTRICHSIWHCQALDRCLRHSFAVEQGLLHQPCSSVTRDATYSTSPMHSTYSTISTRTGSSNVSVSTFRGRRHRFQGPRLSNACKLNNPGFLTDLRPLLAAEQAALLTDD